MNARAITRSRYVDPLNDFGFKVLFAREANKQFLIAFLNELLKGRKRILDLEYNRNEHHGPQADFRRSIYDLTCTAQNGEQFLIEMQQTYQHSFKDRVVYYTSAFIHDCAPRGDSDWNYTLQEVILIALLNFDFKDTPEDRYLHRVHLTEENSSKIFYPKLGYIFIELEKFRKEPNELVTDLDRWLYIFKNMGKLNEIPAALKYGIFEKLFHIAEVTNLSKTEYMRYSKRLKEMWDRNAIKDTGVIEGQEELKQKLIKRHLKRKLSVAEIADMIDVPEDYVNEIKRTLT